MAAALTMRNPYEAVNDKVSADRQAKRVRQDRPSRAQLLAEDAKAIVDELKDVLRSSGHRLQRCPGCGSDLE